MSRYKVIKQSQAFHYTTNGITLETKQRRYDKNTQDNTWEIVWDPDLSLPDISVRIPAYLDQWVDESSSNNWKGVYSTDYTSNDIEYIPAISETKNIYKADSFIIGVHEPVLITKRVSSGLQAGRVVVRGKGSASGTYQYTLNLDGGGTMVNTTGIFEGLAAGNHTLDITDVSVAANEPGSVDLIGYPITVLQEELFGTRYQGQFTDDKGVETYINIMLRGQTDPPTEICLGGNPVTVSTDVTGDDFLSGIMPMNVKVQLLRETDDQFSEFFAVGDDDWRIRIFNGTNLDIIAGMIPENTYYEHLDNPVIIAVDAVAGLTDIDADIIEGWSGPITLFDVINYIQHTYNKIQYGIREFVGLRAELDDATYAKRTLGNYYVSAATFNGMSPKEAINAIINSFYCSLTHSYDNGILINAVDNLTLVGQTVTGSEYVTSGEYVGDVTMDVGTIHIKGDGTGDAYYLKKNQTYGYLSKVRKFVVSDKFTEAEVWEQKTDGSDYTLVVDSPSDGWGTSIATSAEGDGAITLSGVSYYFHNSFEGEEIGWGQRGKASADSILINSPGVRVRFSVDYKADVYPSVDSFPLYPDYRASFLLMYGKNKCLNGDGYVDNNMGELHDVMIGKTQKWETYTTEINLEDEGGNPIESPFVARAIRLWIYGLWVYGINEEPTVRFVDFKNAKIEVLLPEDHEDLVSKVEYDVPGDGIALESEIVLGISEAPQNFGYGVDIGCVIVGDTLANIQEGWVSYTGASGSLKQVIADKIVLLRSDDVIRLEGTIYSDFPKIGEVIYDPTLQSGFFMLQHYSYDLKFNELSFAALQINETQGNIIIEDNSGNVLTEDDENINLQ